MMFFSIFTICVANWLDNGAASCARHGSPVGDACNEIDEAVSFLQRIAIGRVAAENASPENVITEMAVTEEAITEKDTRSREARREATENATVEMSAAKKAAEQEAAIGACCKIVDEHHLDPYVIWRSLRLPAAQRTWWRQNDCNTLVGSTGASRCKGSAPVEQVAAGKTLTEKAETERTAADKTNSREAAVAARVPATLRESVEARPATLSSRMTPAATMCFKALKQSVHDVIGTRLEQAPTPMALFDPAMHSNIGDNLITLAEDRLLQPFPSRVCCKSSCMLDANTHCPDSHDDMKKRGIGTYVLHGGGNWGDLYPVHQAARMKFLEDLASCCPETVVIGMPQNLYYKSSEQEQNHSKIIQSVIQKFATPPVFLWRDRESLAKACELYPSATNVLSPEVAWALYPVFGPSEPRNFEYDVLVSARLEESAAGHRENLDMFGSAVRDASAEKSLEVRYSVGWEDFVERDVDGMYKQWTYNASLLSHRFHAAVSWVRSAPIVVTDKLHMTLLAVLSGAKVVFVDNDYGKLRRTMDVSLSFAGQPCADMRRELLGNQSVGEQVIGMVQAKDFESAAQMVLHDDSLSNLERATLFDEDQPLNEKASNVSNVKSLGSCSLYVGIMTAPGNRERRDAVRSSYLNKFRETAAGRRVIAKFIIGHTAYSSEKATPESLILEHQLEAEAEEHGDIHRIALPELHQNLPDKTFNLLQLGLSSECDFLVKIDDDRVLNQTTAVQLLQEEDPHDLLYAGQEFWDFMAYDSQLGPKGTFAPYMAGPCYLVSKELARRIVEVHSNHAANFIEYGQFSEDLVMGQWVQWEMMHGGDVDYRQVPFLAIESNVTRKGD